MIIIQKGNLLTSDCNFILHQANSESLMGKGIAYRIARKYPLAEKVDREFSFQLEERLGRYSIAKIENDLYIVNLYGQLYRGKPKSKNELEERYGFLRKSLSSFLKDLNKKQRIEKRTYKVGMPYKMASDMAGGDWERVLDIIIDVADEQKLDLYIYKYEKPPN